MGFASDGPINFPCADPLNKKSTDRCGLVMSLFPSCIIFVICFSKTSTLVLHQYNLVISVLEANDKQCDFAV